MSLVPTTTLQATLVADADAIIAATAGLRLVGYHVKETNSAAAAFNIVNGATGAGGNPIIPVVLASGGRDGEWLWPGLDISDGLSLDRISGQCDVYLHTIITPEG